MGKDDRTDPVTFGSMERDIDREMDRILEVEEVLSMKFAREEELESVG